MWVCLWFGSLLCLLALVLSRQAVSFHPRVRKAFADAGFHNLPEQANDEPTRSAQVLAARKLLQALPPSLSELVHTPGEPAHALFSSLMIAGGVLVMQTDFSALTPPLRAPLSLPFGIDLGCANVCSEWAVAALHALRRVCLASLVAMPLVPIPPGCMADLRADMNSDVPLRQRFTGKRRDTVLSDSFVNTVHCTVASFIISCSPSLEFLALALEVHQAYSSSRFAPFHPRNLQEARLLAWWLIAALRFYHLIGTFLCSTVFTYHFMLGIYKPNSHWYKCFWAEYAACRMAASALMLVAVSCWFSDFGNDAPPPLQIAALLAAALHACIFTPFALRNTALCLRNVEYTQADFLWMFKRWKRRERYYDLIIEMLIWYLEMIRRRLKYEKQQRVLSPLNKAMGSARFVGSVSMHHEDGQHEHQQ